VGRRRGTVRCAHCDRRRRIDVGDNRPERLLDRRSRQPRLGKRSVEGAPLPVRGQGSFRHRGLRTRTDVVPSRERSPYRVGGCGSSGQPVVAHSSLTAHSPYGRGMSRKGPPAGPGGLIVVDKPAGMTSHDVVAKVRRIVKTRRVGHAGTLDPMATGVLVLGVERATKLLNHLVLTDKTY